MNVNSLILKNLKKNIKNYYLYVFALVFGVALYFAFVTLQFDPALDQTKGDVKGAAAIKVSVSFWDCHTRSMRSPWGPWAFS